MVSFGHRVQDQSSFSFLGMELFPRYIKVVLIYSQRFFNNITIYWANNTTFDPAASGFSCEIALIFFNTWNDMYLYKKFKFNTFFFSFLSVCLYKTNNIFLYIILLIYLLLIKHLLLILSFSTSSFFNKKNLNMMFATIPSSIAPLKLDNIQK